jgi:hypothetical protein
MRWSSDLAVAPVGTDGVNNGRMGMIAPIHEFAQRVNKRAIENLPSIVELAVLHGTHEGTRELPRTWRCDTDGSSDQMRCVGSSRTSACVYTIGFLTAGRPAGRPPSRKSHGLSRRRHQVHGQTSTGTRAARGCRHCGNATRAREYRDGAVRAGGGSGGGQCAGHSPPCAFQNTEVCVYCFAIAPSLTGSR